MSAANVNPRLAAKRARVRRIRRAAVALTVALFIATWSVIFATLASGHDPGLSASSSGSSKASANKNVAASSSSSSPSSSSTGSSQSDSSQIDGGSTSTSSSSLAPSLSTHQS